MDEINVIVIDYKRKFLALQYLDPVTGKRVTKSSKTSSRKEAEKRAVEWQTELKNGLYKSPSKLTWTEFRERYEREYLGTEVKPHSESRVNSTLNVIERLMSPKRLQQITAAWVTQFRLKAGNGRSVATVNLHLRNLKAALNWAKREGLVSEVPEIKQTGKKKQGPKRMKGRPITAEEFDRLIEQVPNLSAIGEKWAADWQRFLRGLWWSGLRISEAMSLTWDQWGDGIRIQVTDGYVFLLISAEDEKGGKDRIYPAAPEFEEMLLAVSEPNRNGFVFSLPQKGGERPASSEVGRKISDIGELAGVKVDEQQKAGETVVKHASAHDLRRAFGFRWSRRLMPPELMELMRHENIETTMNFYVGQQAELTARKMREALWAETSGLHNTSHNTTKKATSRDDQKVAQTQRFDYRRRDLNPHGALAPKDFESFVSANSTTPACRSGEYTVAVC